jgi:hypothetical protein
MRERHSFIQLPSCLTSRNTYTWGPLSSWTLRMEKWLTFVIHSLFGTLYGSLDCLVSSRLWDFQEDSNNISIILILQLILWLISLTFYVTVNPFNLHFAYILQEVCCQTKHLSQKYIHHLYLLSLPSLILIFTFARLEQEDYQKDQGVRSCILLDSSTSTLLLSLRYITLLIYRMKNRLSWRNARCKFLVPLSWRYFPKKTMMHSLLSLTLSFLNLILLTLLL